MGGILFSDWAETSLGRNVFGPKWVGAETFGYRKLEKPEAHGPQRSPECTAMKALFSQNTVNVACKKN